MITNVACCCAGALSKGRVLLVSQAFAFFDRAITSMLMLAVACSYEPTLAFATTLVHGNFALPRKVRVAHAYQRTGPLALCRLLS